MRVVVFTIALTFGWAVPSQGAGEVLLNEFMARNDAFLQDGDGDYSDWIELYNPTTTNFDLTDDAGDLRKWQFPATNVARGGYLVVFASGKDRAVAGAELHTSFALDDDGEYLGPDLGLRPCAGVK